jgi:hypothetical protein
MAKATKRTIPPPPVNPVEEITLILSKEEAQVILDVSSKVGGTPESTRRRFADSISSALHKVDMYFKNSLDLKVNGNGLWFY